jgi:hypothetical protein
VEPWGCGEQDGSRAAFGGVVKRIVISRLGADRDAESCPGPLEDGRARRGRETFLALAQVPLALDAEQVPSAGDQLRDLRPPARRLLGDPETGDRTPSRRRG